MITKSGEIVTFGKYKGKTIDHVCQFDHSYLEFMFNNGMISKEVIDMRDRSEYEKVKLSNGHATVWEFSTNSNNE